MMSENSLPIKPSKPSEFKFALVGTLWLVATWFVAMELFVPLFVLVLSYLGVPVKALIDQRDVVFVAIIGFSYAPFVLGFAYLLYRRLLPRFGETMKSFLGYARSPKPKDILYALPAFVVYFVASFLLLYIVRTLFPGANLDQSQNLGINSPTNNFQFLATFVMLVIVPPLIEETIFRGFLFGTLRKGFKVVPAAIVTSLLFGLAHMQLNLFLDTFALSLVLCYLRVKTSSLWAGVLLHSLKNCLAFVLLFVIHVG